MSLLFENESFPIKRDIMPSLKRFKTKYPGVYYVDGTAKGTGKPERIFYIRYWKNDKQVEEKAGRQFQNDMTPARAAQIRTQRIEGNQPSNRERREILRTEKQAESNKWTIERLWKEYKKGRKDNKALRTDKGRYEKYLKPAFEKKEPKDLAPLDVDRLRIRLLKKKSPQTVKHVLNLLTWIINFGVKKGLCTGLSFHVEKPEVHNEKTEDLTPQEIKKLLKAIEEDTHSQAGPMMLMALYSGIRRSEMFKLKWGNIDFEKDFIELVDPKGGPSQKVPLNEPARALLENHPRHESSLYVFPGRQGKQRADINKAVNEIKTKAGLPKDFRPLHGLRHVFASMLASSGEVDMYTLQKLLTHKDPRMTQRYAHLRDEVLKKASDLAGEIISEVTKVSNKDDSDDVNKGVEKK